MRRSIFDGSLLFVMCAAALAGASSCGDSTVDDGPKPPPEVHVTAPTTDAPFDKLSDWHLFTDGAKQTPAVDLVPYDVISPLFSDYTTKFRFAFVPKGSTITYSSTDEWDLPVGTVLVKTFAYRADLRDETSKLTLLETRLLWHQASGWTPLTYIWDADQKDAVKNGIGPIIPSTFIDANGATVNNDYTVPNTDECKKCHSKDNVPTPIGWKTRELNRTHSYGGAVGDMNQVDRFVALGWLGADVEPATQRAALSDPFGSDDLARRARSYLDGNCSHCHSKGGFATQSALLLDFASTDPATPMSFDNFGECKPPTSTGGGTCGFVYDIVPGHPETSIMICRLDTTNPKEKMPPFGNRLIHAEGVKLISDWITSLPDPPCN